MPDAARISPTAHYTAQVWSRHGLAHPALAEVADARLFRAAKPLMRLGRRFAGGLDLEAVLLQRHRILDALVDEALADGAVRLVELACGLSSRGVLTAERHPDVEVVEVDLPAMVGHKRTALERGGVSLDNHRLLAIDLLSPTGLDGLEGPGRTVVVTEGLLNYYDTPTVEALARRISPLAGRRGRWLADVALGAKMTAVRGFLPLLSAVARGKVHTHYGSVPAAQVALRSQGFKRVDFHSARDWAERLPGLPVGRRGEALQVFEARR